MYSGWQTWKQQSAFQIPSSVMHIPFWCIKWCFPASKNWNVILVVAFSPSVQLEICFQFMYKQRQHCNSQERTFILPPPYTRGKNWDGVSSLRVVAQQNGMYSHLGLMSQPTRSGFVKMFNPVSLAFLCSDRWLRFKGENIPLSKGQTASSIKHQRICNLSLSRVASAWMQIPSSLHGVIVLCTQHGSRYVEIIGIALHGTCVWQHDVWNTDPGDI